MDPKRKRMLYTEEAMELACCDVREKKTSLRGAARRHGVPTNTLRDRLRGKISMRQQVRTVIPPMEEAKIVKWLEESTRRGFRCTPEYLLSSVQGVLNSSQAITPFKNNKPGRKWYASFMKRHRDEIALFNPLSSPSSHPPTPSTISAVPSSSSPTTQDNTPPPSTSSSSSTLSLVSLLDRILDLAAKAGPGKLVQYRTTYDLERQSDDVEEYYFCDLYSQLTTILTCEADKSLMKNETVDIVPPPCTWPLEKSETLEQTKQFNFDALITCEEHCEKIKTEEVEAKEECKGERPKERKNKKEKKLKQTEKDGHELSKEIKLNLRKKLIKIEQEQTDFDRHANSDSSSSQCVDKDVDSDSMGSEL